MEEEFSIIGYNGDKYIVVYNTPYNSSGICTGCNFEFKNKCIITKEERAIFGDCYKPSISGHLPCISAVFIKQKNI
jgi:hypothetical protein